MKSIVVVSTLSLAAAQVPSPTTTNRVENAKDGMPVFRVNVVSRSIKAINYHHRQGSTVVGLVGTAMNPRATGEARVDSKTGATKVEVHVNKMLPPSSVGEEFLTYVVWAVTPEGRAQNLGELMLSGDDAKLSAATELQSFGIVVTAEPYYAVTQPSDVVVMEGVVKAGTTGTITPIEAKYELLPRGSYMATLPPADRVRLREARNIPVDLMEARQAMAIASSVRADTYAADTMAKARVDLHNAEAFLQSKGDKKKIQTLARNVTQLAEDARIISIKRQEEERLEAERVAAEQRLAAAKTEAEQEARRREMAEAERRLAMEREANAKLAAEREAANRRAAEEAARLSALEASNAAKAKAEADQARLAADQARMAADQARQAALTEQERLRVMAREADEGRLRAEQEKAQIRADLLRQLNLVLETRESARGLIVNMSDVLFDFGKHSLKPGAREKLAKIAGIVITHPGLRLEVEGHTDNVGSEGFNQTLSEKRAETTRAYLVEQGVPSHTITARGFGKMQPVADNNSADGRARNRRVEIVVSGDLISSTTSISGSVAR
ncbi:MAG TPA: OmpA family protein [Bryobacteraceae bacterium]|nr:OmpA family protein [Bryobacteraceae bacterium]